MLLVDLHTHSRFSDGVSRIDQIEDFCLRKQIGVALTDHNEIRGSLQLLERERIPCIPAVEVGTEEGVELLVYFPCPALLEEFYVRAVEPHRRERFMVRSYVKALPCLKAAKQLGAFVSLAHPFAFGRKSLHYHKHPNGKYKRFLVEVLDRIDAVESFNGGVPRQVNRRASHLHTRLGKRFTVGSDSHRLATFGSAGVKIPGAMSDASPALFNTLMENDYLDVKTGVHSPTLAVLPLMAYKHAKFFLTKGNARSNATAIGTHAPRLAVGASES